ncbi:MAG: hypothetical protein MJ223_01375 [Mycoplasmoidaceae bacterium]|nr:hypothetical protein [Mycoplasmoidaceae bacterium]
MHAQTIDGYEYVTREGTDDPQEALKRVLMYRLLEQKAGYDDGMISASVLGSSGDLSTYFTNNYVNIILEMASSDDYNIFVPIDKIDPSKSEISNFLTTVLDEQKFGVVLAQLKDYLDKTKEIDTAKKLQDAIIALNEKIYSYRSEQITNATLEKDVSQTIYSNGLLAPIPLSYASKNDQTHYYTVVTIVLPTD